LGVDDMQEFKELKDDIKCLDKKLDKNEENMNKRLEKNEENMNKFMEVVGASMSKLTEAMTEMKLAMVKDYCEKDDLEKLDIKINMKLDECNNNRKHDIKELDKKVEIIKESQTKCQIECKTKENVEDKIDDKQDKKKNIFRLDLANIIQIAIGVVAIIAILK